MTGTSPRPQVERPPAIISSGLCFKWPGEHPALEFPDLMLPQGEHLFLQGASGSGKSTLLSLLCGLRLPTRGELSILGCSMGSLSADKRDRLRAAEMGVIFQQFNLVPYLSAIANVMIACRISRSRRDKASPSVDAEAQELLNALGIPEALWHRPAPNLSVGQQQRVAAARALVGSPNLILADEPTSALDTENRGRFLDLLLSLAGTRGTSIVFVSHDPSLRGHFSRQVRLEALQ